MAPRFAGGSDPSDALGAGRFFEALSRPMRSCQADVGCCPAYDCPSAHNLKANFPTE